MLVVTCVFLGMFLRTYELSHACMMPSITPPQVMKMMGLGRLAHWLSWFITTYAILSISVVMITAVMYALQMIVYSNAFLVWLFLQVYAAVLILFWSVSDG